MRARALSRIFSCVVVAKLEERRINNNRCQQSTTKLWSHEQTHTPTRLFKIYHKVSGWWWLTPIYYNTLQQREFSLSLSLIANCNTASMVVVQKQQRPEVRKGLLLFVGPVLVGPTFPNPDEHLLGCKIYTTTWSTNTLPFVPPRCKRSIDLYMQTVYISIYATVYISIYIYIEIYTR